jgi:copper homeostasis protein
MASVEVVVTTPNELKIAQQSGVSRVELASALSEGALTPSVGLMKNAIKIAKVPIHVMIRPRPGDFCYRPDEIRVMIEDVREASRLGSDGIIFGVLTGNNHANWEAIDRIVKAAGAMSITFHRAFDELIDRDCFLKKIIERYPQLNRMMTGDYKNEHMKELIRKFGKRLSIVPSFDVRVDNVGEIVSDTGCLDVHTGIGVRTPENALGQIDRDKVRKLIQNAKNRLKV